MNALQSTEQMYRRMRLELPPYLPTAIPYLLVVHRELENLEGPLDHLLCAKRRHEVLTQIPRIIQEYEVEARAAEAIHALLPKPRLSNAISSRTELIAAQIEPRIPRHCSGLDFGCGRADVALRLRHSFDNLTLCDVADYRVPAAHELPFTLDRATLDSSRFDFAMANLVFHHCDNPDQEIRWLAEHAERLLVIESVVNPMMPWPVIALIDWIYNRCLEPDALVPVPGNYREASEWISSCDAAGFALQYCEDFGWDTLIVPEFHKLFSFSRK